MVGRRSSSRSRFELVDGPPPAPGTPPGPPPSPSRLVPLVVVLAAALLVLVAAVVLPHRSSDTEIPPADPSVSASPTPSRPSCDLAEEGCRVVLAAAWRRETAAVVRDRLDPDDTYFTGYSYAMTPLYTTGPRLNALGLDVYRLGGGGTEVFIQIARSRADAVRCGQLTRHRCFGQRFMDGNRFSMTTTPGVAAGIEVQHIPAGTYVITVVARNTSRGPTLPLNNGDLIAVAQDPRLRPPPG